MKKLTCLWQTLESTLDLKAIDEHWRSCLKDEYEVVRQCFLNTQEIATCFAPPGQKKQFAITEFDGKYYATDPETNEVHREFKKSELTVRLFDVERFGRLLLPSLGWNGPPSKSLGVKRYCQLGRLPIEYGGHSCFLAIPAHSNELCEILDDISMRVNHRRYLVLVSTPGKQNQRVASVLERTQGHLFTCDEIFRLTASGELVVIPQKMAGIAEIFGAQPSGNIFKRSGKGDWTIAFNGESQTISHVTGLTYIAILLSSPGFEFAIQDLDELATGVNAAHTKGESIPLTTKESLRDIHERLNEARRELASATSDRDLEVIDDRQEEIEFLSQEVKRTINRSGKIRDKSELDDMRKRVARNINTAIRNIRKQNDSLATHLDSCITRGLKLSYGPADPISWVAIN
jgi:hypothetical protein